MIGWVLMQASPDGEIKPLSAHRIQDFALDDMKRKSQEEPLSRFYVVEVEAGDFDD